jgi:ABC-type nitrate/sulfonate/bicarbonate transport system permease component
MRRRITVNRVTVIQVGSLLALLGAWELIGRGGLVGGEVLPPFSRVAGQLGPLLREPLIRYDIQVSLYEIWVGFLLGTGGGLLAGLVVGCSPFWRHALEPLLYYLGAVPKIIVLPVILLAVGSGFSSKIGLGALSAFFPMVITTLAASDEVQQVWLRAARTLGAGRLRLVGSVILPATAGPLLAGARLSLGAAVVGALLAETSVASAGIGYRAIQFYSELRIAQMYALLLLVFVAAVLANALISLLIRQLTRYQSSAIKDAVLA